MFIITHKTKLNYSILSRVFSSSIRLDLLTVDRTPVATGVLRPFVTTKVFEQEVVVRVDVVWVFVVKNNPID